MQEELDYFAFLQGDDAGDARARTRESSPATSVFYLKVGRPRDDDAIVAAVRDAIGPGPLLRIDPNEAWDAATAVERIRRLAAHDLDWVEQPVPHWDVAGLAQVRRKVDVEDRRRPGRLHDAAAARGARGARRPTSSCRARHDAGGLLPFRRQASMCEAWGLNVNLHAFMQSEISFLAHAQVASTVPNLTNGNQAMHQLLAERLTTGVDVETRDGRYALNDAPGHGFEIDEDAVARAHERWQRDGAVQHDRVA